MFQIYMESSQWKETHTYKKSEIINLCVDMHLPLSKFHWKHILYVDNFFTENQDVKKKKNKKLDFYYIIELEKGFCVPMINDWKTLRINFTISILFLYQPPIKIDLVISDFCLVSHIFLVIDIHKIFSRSRFQSCFIEKTILIIACQLPINPSESKLPIQETESKINIINKLFGERKNNIKLSNFFFFFWFYQTI